MAYESALSRKQKLKRGLGLAVWGSLSPKKFPSDRTAREAAEREIERAEQRQIDKKATDIAERIAQLKGMPAGRGKTVAEAMAAGHSETAALRINQLEKMRGGKAAALEGVSEKPLAAKAGPSPAAQQKQALAARKKVEEAKKLAAEQAAKKDKLAKMAAALKKGK